MIKIQGAQRSDGEFVRQCMEELKGTAFDKKSFDSVYEQVFYSEDYYPFIISSGEQPCGYLGLRIENQLHHNGKVAEILELLVLPEFRKQAVGKEALDFSVAFAREQNCLLIELSTNQKRLDAQRFYLRHGFRNSHFKLTREL